MGAKFRRGGSVVLAAATWALAPISARAHSFYSDPDLAGRRAELQQGLQAVPTAAGVSALDRMRACGLVIGLRASSVTRETAPNGAFHLQPGDMTIFVVFEATSLPSEMRRPEVARWFVRGAHAEPASAWAREIQLAPFPIQMNSRTRC